jgi:hypothetical protein
VWVGVACQGKPEPHTSPHQAPNTLNSLCVSPHACAAGKETVNTLYGTRVAVLAGDFLFAQSSWLIANLENMEVGGGAVPVTKRPVSAFVRVLHHQAATTDTSVSVASDDIQPTHPSSQTSRLWSKLSVAALSSSKRACSSNPVSLGSAVYVISS